MLERLLNEENACLKSENGLLRDNIRRITHFNNGHKSQADLLSISKDLQIELSVLETQRKLITSLEQTLDSTQIEYENLLENSLQNARIHSNKPIQYNYLAELVAKEEAEAKEMHENLKKQISLAAKELSEVKSAQIHQNAELVQSSSLVPSKSPSIHKSGARINELKKNKYLSPLP